MLTVRYCVVVGVPGVVMEVYIVCVWRTWAVCVSVTVVRPDVVLLYFVDTSVVVTVAGTDNVDVEVRD